MTRRGLLGFLPALLALGWGHRAHAQSGAMTTTTDQYFRVETTAGTDRKGRATAWGYVYSLSGRGGGRPRLLLETLDAAGKPIAQQLVYVDEDFASGRVYWEARPNTPGAAYRATVQSVVSTFNGAP
jgi:hypothetical protein